MLNCSLLVAYGLCASAKDRPGQRVLFRSKEGRGPWSRLGAPAATASHRAPSLPKVSVKYAKTSRSVPKIRSTSLNFSQNFVPSMMMSRSPSAFAATTSRYSYSRIRAANAPCFCAHRSASDWLTHSVDGVRTRLQAHDCEHTVTTQSHGGVERSVKYSMPNYRKICIWSIFPKCQSKFRVHQPSVAAAALISSTRLMSKS